MQSIAQRASSFSEWSVKHRDIVFTLLVTTTMRVWFAIWGAAVIIAQGTPIVPNPPTLYHGLPRVPDEGLGLLLAPWQRWDAIWYLRIAEFGYNRADLSLAFSPLFPILVRALAQVTQSYILSSLIISTLAIFAIFILLYRLSQEISDPMTAQRAVVYLAVFPTSFFLFGAYAEPILLLSALSVFYFGRHGRWGPAAIASSAAILARPFGFMIVIPLLIEALLSRGRRLTWLIALGAAVGTFGLWMLYLQINFNDPLAWLHIPQQSWQYVNVIPGQTVLWTIQFILSGDGAIGNNILDLSLTLIIFLAIIWGARKLPLSFLAFALVLVVSPLFIYARAAGGDISPMSGMGRRVIIAFPAFIALAAYWRGRWKEPILIFTFATAQVILFVVFVKWLMVD